MNWCAAVQEAGYLSAGVWTELIVTPTVYGTLMHIGVGNEV